MEPSWLHNRWCLSIQYAHHRIPGSNVSVFRFLKMFISRSLYTTQTHITYSHTLYPCVTLPPTYKFLTPLLMNAHDSEWYLPTTLILTQFLLGNPTPSIVPPSFLTSSSILPLLSPTPTSPTNYRGHYSSALSIREQRTNSGFQRSPSPLAFPPRHPPPQVCRLPPRPLPMHRPNQSHTLHHTMLPPPPGSDSTPTSTRGRRHLLPPPPPTSPASEPATLGARAHTHSHASLTSFPAPGLAGYAGTQPGRRGLGTRECARPAPSRGPPRSPRLPAGEGEDTATPPPPRHTTSVAVAPCPNPRSAPPTYGTDLCTHRRYCALCRLILRRRVFPRSLCGSLRLLEAAPRLRGCWRPPPSSSPPAPPRSAGGWG